MVEARQHFLRHSLSQVAILGILLIGTLFANEKLQDNPPQEAAQVNLDSMSSDSRFKALTIRVGLLEGYKKVTFQMNGCYRVESMSGEILRASGSSPARWRARIEDSTASQILYSVLVASFTSREKAMELAESFAVRDINAVVKQIGGPVELDSSDVLCDNTLYRVQIGTFKTEAEAKALLKDCDDEFNPRVIREVIRRSKGRVEFFDSDMLESYMTEGGFRIIPEEKSANLTIYGVLVGTGFSYERQEDRSYEGIIEIYLDHAGMLAVLNEVPIDTYLRGVVPAEMPANFPMDALKAQAVAARTVVIAKKATKHINDPFELCAHVHCQVYSGITRQDERTNQAITETKGELLMANGDLVDAFYSAVCGGHTEDAENTWMAPMRSPSIGVPCNCCDSITYPDLTTEAGVRKWIYSSPAVCCNLDDHKVPVAADYGRKHFRWEVSYTRTELEDIIREKTGEAVGTLYDILPIHRGRSGRLSEIEILGSRKNLRIKRELKIRRALAKTQLGKLLFSGGSHSRQQRYSHRNRVLRRRLGTRCGYVPMRSRTDGRRRKNL